MSFIKMATGFLVIGVGLGLAKIMKLSASKQRLNKEILDLIKIKTLIIDRIPRAHLVKLVPSTTSRLNGVRYSVDISLFEQMDHKDKHTKETKKNPFLPPFEDEKYILDLGEGHRLLYNKFPVFDRHVLVVTREFLEQTNLSFEDVRQTMTVVKAQEGMFFYNCGKLSGASQRHRHTQCLPMEGKKLVLIDQMSQFAKGKQAEGKTNVVLKFDPFEFEHGMVVFEQNLSVEELTDRAWKAYSSLITRLVLTSDPNVSVSYNILGTEGFLMVVPRKREEVCSEYGVNSLAFAGSFMAKSQEAFERMLQETPEALLNSLTFRDAKELGDYKNTLV